MSNQSAQSNPVVEEMFSVGAHFGFSRSRRHPSVRNFIYGTRNKTEIINLEETAKQLDTAKAVAAKIASEGKRILFVGTKNEGKDVVKAAAERISMPYVENRWVGGTLSNFSEIKKRINHMNDLIDRREKEGFQKYTKKERLLFDREIERLQETFGGLADMQDMPAALFVLDVRHEHNAVAEAKQKGIPVITLSSSDCDITDIAYPIVANDAAVPSIQFFVYHIVSAFEEGKKNAVKKEAAVSAE